MIDNIDNTPRPPQSQRLFTASEIAQFEYCPLSWWYEHFGPTARADTEELFARLVELEHEYGSQAPSLPEYQVIEQLLLRQNAFNEGIHQHTDYDHGPQRGLKADSSSNDLLHRLTLIAICILLIAIILIVAGLFLGR
uniref:Uncharacterized protein n=1 Tax=Thermosporothrix sp. COM3 TaxID=2490863 RepID=A0A455SNE4_9CHLR|nr:hypothetical protein KTC_39310 [Thermosporothrix sp. COM3]